MSNATTSRPAGDAATLTRQVRQLQEHYPDLYDYLKRRDRALERALARIPSRADIELSSVFNARAYLEKTLRELAPGVGELCESEVRRG
jgi:hypothetical protein